MIANQANIQHECEINLEKEKNQKRKTKKSREKKQTQKNENQKTFHATLEFA